MKNKGKIGENIAVRFLMKQGFSIIQRNFRIKAGELDIVAMKDEILYFFEVKTVSRDTVNRPEENVHRKKIRKLAKTVEVFLMKHPNLGNLEWRFFVANVILDEGTATYRIYFVSDNLS